MANKNKINKKDAIRLLGTESTVEENKCAMFGSSLWVFLCKRIKKGILGFIWEFRHFNHLAVRLRVLVYFMCLFNIKVNKRGT